MAEANSLRDCLEEIITYGDQQDADLWLSEQILRIAELKHRFPHSISLVQAADPYEPLTSRFNCYAHSFGLTGNQRVLRIMEEYPRIFPGREFVQTLVNGSLTSISPDDAFDGDHVIYTKAEIEHAGIIRDRKVESKWGLGHLWHHGVDEVPRRYGDCVWYFRRLDRDLAVRAFLEYAKQRGASAGFAQI
jgi:hypothetical protein